MKNINLLVIFLLFLTTLIIPQNSNAAMDCFRDPIYDYAWTGKITTGARVRDVACMEGSSVLTTLPVGTIINITGETDGWYRIKTSNGTEGWIGQWLIAVTDKTNLPTFTTQPTKVIEPEVISEPTPTTYSSKPLTQRLRGYILLQVENNGEAWYVHPDNDQRYYMKDGPTAYEMMRTFGLGITNDDLAKIQAGNSSLVNRLKGRILLQVEERGEAYYVNPKDGSVHYMKDGKAAYKIMRELSLGITNSDLNKITSSIFQSIPYSSNTSTTSNDSTMLTITPENTPSNIDIQALNEYWLQKINELRATAGLRQLSLDTRWQETATEYADYMKTNQVYAHERADGSTMHQWINTKGLNFTTRYSTNGWTDNYFTENIAWEYTDNSQQGAERALEDTLNFYLSEKASNGPHYRTIYHKDWNSLGLGFAFEKINQNKYKIYIVSHYGSLEL